MRTLWITAAASICASCGPSLEDRVGDLVEAKEVWVSVAGDKPYSYTLKFGQRPPYTVVVSNPGVLRENWVEDPECPDVGECLVTPTMRELFQFVLELTDDQFRSGGELTIEYDEDMGFPKRIFFDHRRGSHSASSLEISNLEFVQD